MSRQKPLVKLLIFTSLLMLFLTPFVVQGLKGADKNPIAQNTDPLSSSTNEIDPNIHIRNFTRVIEVNESGYIVYHDSYIFSNDGPNSHFSILIGLTDEEANEIIYFQAYDETMGPLSGELSHFKFNQTSIMEILLNEPLLPYSEKIVNVVISLKGFINYQSAFNRMMVYTQLVPRSPYPISYYTTEVHVPEAAQNVQVSDIDNYVGPLENLPTVHRFFPGSASAFADIHNTISYVDSDTKLFQINELTRTITVNPWGYIQVEERHELQFYSNNYGTELHFKIPESYRDFKVYDDLGEILGVEPAASGNSQGLIDIKVLFIVNRAPMQYGQKMIYHISYSLPLEKYYTNNFGKKNFVIDLYPTRCDYLIIHSNVHVELMDAVSVLRMNYPLENVVETARSIVFETSHDYITPLHHEIFDVTYKINGALMIDRAIIFSLIFTAIGALYIVQVSRKERKEEIVISATAIPITELQQFVTLYEEKNALMIELDTLEQNLLRRKIQKKAYMREEKTLSTKLKSLEEELIPFKKELLESGSAVANVVQKLDYLEAEKISLKDSLRNLTNRYRKGKLPSKAAYEKLANDLEKKIASNQRKIDRNINELRSYLI